MSTSATFPPVWRDAAPIRRSSISCRSASGRHRGRPLSRSAAAFALRLFDLTGAQLAMRTEVQFLRRGKTVKLAMSPTLTLLDYLRSIERATGTKEGCARVTAAPARSCCGACAANAWSTSR